MLDTLQRKNSERTRLSNVGITVNPRIGLGDGLQFSSLPENHFLNFGTKLHDISQPWFFDHNPYVVRDSDFPITQKHELWNFGPTQRAWGKPRNPDEAMVYLSNAESHASTIFGIQARMNRPRLYRFENFPFEERENILLHIDGRSHGMLPQFIIDHVIKKYGGTGKLFQVGLCGETFGIPRIHTETMWELAEVISQARIFIGPDSGPSWVASCYPDVITKVVRMKPSADELRRHIPLEIRNVHSHWDDRCRMIYNPTDEDVGFTWSYKRI